MHLDRSHMNVSWKLQDSLRRLYQLNFSLQSTERPVGASGPPFMCRQIAEIVKVCLSGLARARFLCKAALRWYLRTPPPSFGPYPEPETTALDAAATATAMRESSPKIGSDHPLSAWLGSPASLGEVLAWMFPSLVSKGGRRRGLRS